MKKLFIIILLALFLPLGVLAQQEEMFKARVLQVLDQKENIDEAGVLLLQQNLKLKALDGSFAGQEITFYGIDDFQVVSGQVYEAGDRVVVNHRQDEAGKDVFFVLDYDRTNPIIWLACIFILSVIFIGRWKGLRSLIGLVASFVVILKFIIPQIVAGSNPILISVTGSIVILFFAIYLTQGFGRKSHLANLALVTSLLFTAVLSVFFTHLAQLSGYLGEETIFLLESSQGSINLQGLLLAGIMLGTLGVLDDVIISQISTVEQIKLANPNLSKKQVYKMSLKVGVDHITSMINTLFFAYAGVALPMLILFSQSDVLGLNLTQVINNEMIATEIIRTLLGSIGLVFSIPIANFLASYFLSVKK